MALSKDAIAMIAGIMGLSAEDMTAKITSEAEEKITIPQGKFLSDSDISSRESLKYKEGKDAALEMYAKKIKKENDYSIESRDLDEVMSHHLEKIKSTYSKDESDRVKDLEASLQKQKNTYETELEGLKTNLSKVSMDAMKANTRAELISAIPEGLTLKPDDAITLFNSRYAVEQTDEGMVVKKGNEILRDDKSAKPLELKNVFSTFVIEEGYAKGPDGRGAGNEHGKKGSAFTGVKSPEEFQRTWQSKNPGVSTASPQYDDDYASWRKSQTEA